jgi:predicted RNase H-like nuclease
MIAGIDGCRGGWVIATAEAWPPGEPVRFQSVETFRECVSRTAGCAAVVVDMPIGLPSKPEGRLCDALARKAMGRAASSIFLAPPRATLDAATPEEFQALHKKLTGQGAGLPVWGIVRKLLQVDSVMRADPALQNRVFEFYPELAWRRLFGQPLLSKHLAAGALQRISLLNRISANWAGDPAAFDLPREVRLDDMLDAAVGLPVAHAIATGGEAFRLPEGDVPLDEVGLRMEIWY